MNSSARLLAPIALIVCAVAVLIVIMGTAGSGDDSLDAPPAAQESASDRSPAAETIEKTTPSRSTYTVETGDTLGAIAEETGVSVERLQELNPALDPQALATGQKIKLVQ